MRTERPAPLLLVLLLTTALAAHAGSPPRPPTLTPGDYEYAKAHAAWFIRERMQKEKIQGLSVALVDDQRLVWAEGFGFADRAAKVPATADTVYRAGAVTKLFTVVAALQLAEQGRLGLDRPLAEYVPNFSMRTRFPAAPPVTIRNLMTHHSGLPSDHLKGMWTETPQPLTALPDLLREDYVGNPPGTVFSYSNVGMALLGLAVQNASGQEYGAEVAQNVLRPLAMDRSTLAHGPAHGPEASKAYAGAADAVETPLRDVPSSGLNTSARDLGHFVRMILGEGQADGKRILKPESVREMLRPQNLGVPLDLDHRQGLGWALAGFGALDLQHAGPTAHHSGATLYHRAEIVVLPEEKLGVVVLVNTRTKEKDAELVAAEILRLALETKTGRPQPPKKKPETGPFLTADELRAYAGDYATSGGLLRITPQRDYLSAAFMGRTFRLVPRSDKRLEPQYRFLGFIPVNLGELGTYGLGRRTVAGREILCVASGSREMLFGEKVTAGPIPGAWRRRTGRYDFVNSGKETRVFDNVVVRNVDGLLVVEFELTAAGNAPMSNVLKPLSDTEAVALGLGRGAGETVRGATVGDAELIYFSGYELKRRP